MPFEWIAAVRFLREGRMQSLLIIVGVGVGVAVIVFMSALLSGLQANLIKRTLSSQAHITLLPPEEIARPQQATDTTALRLQKQAQRLPTRRLPSSASSRSATTGLFPWPNG